MNKEQERRIRSAALARWRVERGDYKRILDEESRRLAGQHFELQRLVVPGASVAEVRANVRRPPAIRPLDPAERARIISRAHKELRAWGKLPITTGRAYDKLFDAAVVPGRPDLTYKRYVESLLAYRAQQMRNLVHREKGKKSKGPDDAERSPSAEARTTAKKKRRKSRKPGSSAKSRSVWTVRGGLPSLGRRR